MSEAAPALSAERLGAYFALLEVSSLLQFAVDEHLRKPRARRHQTD